VGFGDGARRVEVSVPRLTPAQLAALAQHVRRRGGAQLKPMPVAQIIAAIDRAIERLLNPADPCRLELELLLPRITGFDAEMVRLGLNAYLKTFRAPQLQRFVAEDFPNPKLLDEFQPRPKGGMARALGPELLAHVWAGNVPGLPLWSLICGLLVKAPAVGKVASAEPLFASLFARLLAEVEPRLADALAIVWFKGGDSASERVLFGEADVVLAYGGNDTLAALREQIPVTTRFPAPRTQAQCRPGVCCCAGCAACAGRGACRCAGRGALRAAGLLFAAHLLRRPWRPRHAA
jgi:hypothetical protein